MAVLGLALLQLAADDDAMEEEELQEEEEQLNMHMHFSMAAASAAATAADAPASRPTRKRVVQRGTPMSSCLAHSMISIMSTKRRTSSIFG